MLKKDKDGNYVPIRDTLSWSQMRAAVVALGDYLKYGLTVFNARSYKKLQDLTMIALGDLCNMNVDDGYAGPGDVSRDAALEAAYWYIKDEHGIWMKVRGCHRPDIFAGRDMMHYLRSKQKNFMVMVEAADGQLMVSTEFLSNAVKSPNFERIPAAIYACEILRRMTDIDPAAAADVRRFLS